MARLQEFYENTVVSSLREQFEYASVMQVPRISKVTLNMGVGEALADKKILDNEQVLMYRDFLLNYLAERDISENDLLSKNPFSQDEDEDDSAKGIMRKAQASRFL